MSNIYKEPELTYLVLDFNKEEETRVCIKSIKERTKFPHKVIYLHNGENNYSNLLFAGGLIDHFIQTKQNNGLGIGTRDLFASCFSKYAFYLQNDQWLGRDFDQFEFDQIKQSLEHPQCASVSLAGPVCGQGVYSERGHIIKTEFYKKLERELPLTFGGAGPYHDTIWREGQIQSYYKENKLTHYTNWPKMVVDNGKTAIRQNPDGSHWKHFPDSKQLWLLSGPVKEKFVYPKFTDTEWEEVLKTQVWPDGKIPSSEINDSFHVWN